MAKRGGMAINPFGGHARLDKLPDEDFFDVAPGSGIEAMVRMTILDAASSYLFWGLGVNGCTSDEFLHAADYFFKITTDRRTWPDECWEVAGVHVEVEGRKRNYKSFDLTEAEVESMLFPSQFEIAGFARSMSIERFRRLLKQKRKNIVEANRKQILDYLQSLRQAAAQRGQWLRDGVRAGDWMETLTQPEPESLAALLYPTKAVARMEPARLFQMPRRVHGRRPWAKAA